MPDREKVIKSVDICLGNGHCADCHYCLGRKGITTMDCRKYLLTDVFVLLNEQEVKAGKWITKIRHEHYPSGKQYEEDFCSVCGKRGSLEYQFCPNCGAKMTKENR